MLRLSGVKNRKPALTQFLGIPEEELALEPYLIGMEIKKGDVFLICSDGLTDMVTDREIAEILDRGALPAQMAMDLLVEALINGGRDNITVICCKAEEAKDSKESGKREKEGERTVKIQDMVLVIQKS